MPNEMSDAFVFFGATGDLAYKQIFPSLQRLIKDEGFNLPIIGVAKAGWSVDQLKARAKDSLEHYGGIDQAVFDKMAGLLRYVDGDYANAATFTELRKQLGQAQRPLHYLAVPPSLFGTVAAGLAKSGCATNARVVVEKPFGHNLSAAQQLNKTLHQFFPKKISTASTTISAKSWCRTSCIHASRTRSSSRCGIATTFAVSRSRQVLRRNGRVA